jgi:peptidoglycan hydrolase-like protein with peptidoglycan-binding domain
MKISILAATLGIATLAATPLFAQSETQSPGAGKTPSATESPSGGASGAPHQKSMSHRSRASSGMSSQTVKQVQQKLSQQGLDVGPVDGKMGPKTRSAVKQFQEQKGIQGNGSLNRQTLAALGVQSRSGPSKSRGAKSPGASQMNSSPSGSESGSSSGMGSSPSSGGSSGSMGGGTSH